MKRISAIGFLLVAISLTACYGTKPPPPISSPVGPPGLSKLPVWNPPDLPDELSKLLPLYKKALIERAHYLSPAAAARYADANIQSLTARYSGQEQALKDEIGRRLRQMPTPSDPSVPRRYPTDREP